MFVRSLLPVLAAVIGLNISAYASVALIHESPDHIILEFTAPDPTIVNTKLDEETFIAIRLDQYATSGQAGGPQTPTISRLIAIPEGKEPALTVLTQKKSDLNISGKLIPFAPPKNHCGLQSTPVASRSANYQGRPLDDAMLELSPSSYIGPVKGALLTFRPLTYHTKDKKFKIIKKALVRVDFKKVTPSRNDVAPILANAMSPRDYHFARAVFINKAAFPRFGQTQRVPTDLLIVHSEFISAAEQLVKFKERQGRAVILKPFNNPSAGAIHDYIKEKYRSSMPPDHTILIGSSEYIPMPSDNGTVTDLPYTLLDDGPFPDISLARLPAQSADDLAAMIEKITLRARLPKNRSLLFTSGFDTQWCHKNVSYIAEKILSQSAVGLDIDYLYASQGHRTQAVTKAYAKGPSLIIYDGHGHAAGMSEIPLFKRHSQLISAPSAPLLINMACQNAASNSSASTATAPESSFAVEMLTSETSGISGVLATAGQSSGHDFLRHILRAAFYDERHAREPYHDIRDIGKAILYGRIKLVEEFNVAPHAIENIRSFIYYGDPSAEIL